MKEQSAGGVCQAEGQRAQRSECRVQNCQCSVEDSSVDLISKVCQGMALAGSRGVLPGSGLEIWFQT